MARVIVLESFGETLEGVSSPRVRNAILDAIQLLERLPERGSQDLPPKIRQRFPYARKLVVPPFDVIYQYSHETDTAVVIGLIHQRAMH